MTLKNSAVENKYIYPYNFWCFYICPEIQLELAVKVPLVAETSLHEFH